MRLPVVRWFFSLPASIFYCLAASSLYDTLDAPEGIPAAVALLAELLLSTGIALWLLADARQRGRSLPYDTGTFFFLAWPILAPVYLFSTRGWRAFAVFGGFLLFYLGSAFFYNVLYSLWTTFQ